jgi:hypothetical protein
MSLSSHPPPHFEDHDMEKEGEKIAGLPISEDAIRNGSVDPATILKHAVDGDEALKAFANYQGSVIHIDEATNKRLLRKIDMNLMPVCIHIFTFLHSLLVEKKREELGTENGVEKCGRSSKPRVFQVLLNNEE